MLCFFIELLSLWTLDELRFSEMFPALYTEDEHSSIVVVQMDAATMNLCMVDGALYSDYVPFLLLS